MNEKQKDIIELAIEFLDKLKGLSPQQAVIVLETAKTLMNANY
ncbi:MAG: hypothetical protein PHQ89_03955 [Bacilli bacterium]|nr:hypothetical protein [Bacilli bacterium]